ncbi:hypothetical protein, partial [Sicyoidochytrium minutum DNA virus]
VLLLVTHTKEIVVDLHSNEF